MTSPSLPPDSSPSPSPSPSFRPFSRLPIELTQHIIESSIPLHFHSSTYRERQKNLRSFCLVSRLFRQLASPLLLTIIKLTHPTSLKLWQKAANSKPVAKEFVVEGAGGDWFPALEIRSLLAAFANIQLLVVDRCEGVLDLALISKLANLSSLRLADYSIESSQSFVLAKLQELQMLYVQHDKPLDEIFTPTSAPHLRALAVYQSEEPIEGLSNLLGYLVAHLEVISLDYGLIDQISEKVLPEILAKTLFDKRFAINGDLSCARFLRLFSMSEPDCATVLSVDKAKDLDRDLRKKTSITTPSILYLPPIDTQDQFTTDEIHNIVEKLSKTCKSLEIELVFEEQPQDWNLDSGISFDFWGRMKAQKTRDSQ